MMEVKGGELGLQVLQAVQGLSARMDRLEGWMERLGAEFVRTRGEIQDVRTELKGEIQQVRTELKEEIQQVRTELKEEIRQVNGRIDRTNDALTLMGSVLHQAMTARFDNLEQRVRVLEER